MRLSQLLADPYSTAVEYTLIAVGVGLLLIATFAPSSARPLILAFATWLGLNACVFVWLILRVTTAPD